MEVSRARTRDAAQAARIAAGAESAVAAAEEGARIIRREAAELYDRWRLRTEAAEAAAEEARTAFQYATNAAEGAILDLSEAKEELDVAEGYSREAKETVALQGQRIMELEGRAGEQTCREYGTELAQLRSQSAARESDLVSEVLSLKRRIVESSRVEGQIEGLRARLAGEAALAREAHAHAAADREAAAQGMAAARSDERREGERKCGALREEHSLYLQVRPLHVCGDPSRCSFCTWILSSSCIPGALKPGLRVRARDKVRAPNVVHALTNEVASLAIHIGVCA